MDNGTEVIAIDYDETITDQTPFPFEGKIRDDARIYIKKLYEDGYKLILWTARKEPAYTEAVERLKREGLYQYFSEDYDTGFTGKVIADYYIDDRNVMSEIDWEKIYRFITGRKKNVSGT